MGNIRKVCLAILIVFSAASGYAQTTDSIDVEIKRIDYNNPKKYSIKDIKVLGVQMLSPDLIISSTGITKGDSIILPSDYISNALQMLWSTQYYSNIKAIVEIEGDDAFISLQLQERPRVSMWKFEGVSGSQKKEIEERLKLRARTELSDFAVKNSMDIIKRYLAEKAFLNTEITLKQENDTAANKSVGKKLGNNFVIVTFVIDKRSKVKIGEVSFEGNSAIPEKKLKSSLKKTREKALKNMFKGAKFKESEYSDDKLNLIDYMQSKGYRDASVLKDSIYRINDKRLGIKITLNEGKKYYYRNISWIGNTKYKTDELDVMLNLRRGDVYDKKMMYSRLGLESAGAAEGEITVSSLYQNDGHLMFQLDPVETVIEGDSIDIEMRMSEGKQATVNSVTIRGNMRTNDRVIRREVAVRPGELYDQSLLIRSIRMLGQMQHFNPENIMPDIQPISEELVDIGFDLEEKPSDQFEISGGWGAGMFVASIGVTFNNVSMRKFFDKKSWKPYPAGDNQQLRLSLQSNGTYYKAFSFSFLEPWLGGKKPNSLSISAYYSNESDAYYVWQKSDSRFMTIGASAGLGKRLAWPDPYFQIMGELAYKAYKLKDWKYFLMENGTANTFELIGTLGRNSIDAPIFPRRGSDITVKLSMTPPYSLFNKNADYAGMSQQDRYRWIEYYKINTKASFFVPMIEKSKKNLVFMAKGEFGYLGHYNPDKISPFEGFTMGGDGMTGYSLYGIENIGLRGYRNDALTPYARTEGRQARLYTKLTAELRYPIVLQPSTTVYILTFLEAGNAFSGWREYNPFDLKRSAGVGIRLFLPVVGMFGIDWGYGFDKLSNGEGKKGEIHFSIGQNF